MNLDEKPNLIDTQTLHANRPLSPHLSIYKLQLTSGLSILHRMTGAYLYCGLMLLAWAIFTFVYFPNVIEEINIYLNECITLFVLFRLMLLAWVFSIFYHLLNGIRHLFWDIGKGFDLKTTYFTGKLVIFLAIILTFTMCGLVVTKNNDSTQEIIIIEEDK
ncbi:MAG: succinate dehydrogenase, cytochrome b556 subunit [Rickettsiales bacterium]